MLHVKQSYFVSRSEGHRRAKTGGMDGAQNEAQGGALQRLKQGVKALQTDGPFLGFFPQTFSPACGKMLWKTATIQAQCRPPQDARPRGGDEARSAPHWTRLTSPCLGSGRPGAQLARPLARRWPILKHKFIQWVRKRASNWRAHKFLLISFTLACELRPQGAPQVANAPFVGGQAWADGCAKLTRIDAIGRAKACG